MQQFFVDAWRAYRRLPGWGQVAAVVFGIVLVGGAVSGDDTNDLGVAAGDVTTKVEDRLPQASRAVALTDGTPPPSVAPATAPPTTETLRATTAVAAVTTSTLAPPPPEVALVAATPDCHPSYEGACLPADASDVDCAGGTGNGPVYAAEQDFRVIGTDVYGLDGDGDGYACDSESGGAVVAIDAPALADPAPAAAQIISYANCAAARAAGAAPVYRGEPGYGPHLDRDGDGVGCE